jgi:undecaprenyl diphosphate synthase
VQELPKLPRHVAIIMDGNGRWANQRGLPRVEGHRRGVESVRNIVRAAGDIGIPYLTLFSFSSENWSRPKSEILDLMGLIRLFIQRDLADLHKDNVRVRIIGERDGLDADIVKLVADAETLTRNNTKLNLTVAFNYGSRAEIVRAAKALAAKVERGEMVASQITQETFSEALDTAELPDPDLFIRTSGEQRLSNFLLWQLAYAELVFVDTYWPDFNRIHLDAALATYQLRERRFGGLTRQQSA